MTDLTLYVYPGGQGLDSISPPCQKVQLALRFAGIPHETRVLSSPMAAERESPTGRLPAVDLDGELLSDSVAILDRLIEDHPDAGLAFEDPLEAARDRMWDIFTTDHLYWLGYYLRWMVEENRERLLARMRRGAGFLVGRIILPWFYVPKAKKRARLHSVGRRSREEVLDALARALDMVEAALADGPWLDGRDRPGRGDVAVATTVSQAGFPDGTSEAKELLGPRAAVREHAERTFEACETDLPAYWDDLRAG